MPNKSFFLVVDGIDGTGKTTQIERLCQWLSSEGINIETTKEPGGTTVGVKIRELLLSTEYDLSPESELLLYFADRKEHQKKVISLLDKGVSVVSDRFLSATWAYQVYGRGLSGELVKELTPWCVSRFPDLTIILYMDEDTALERSKARLAASGLESAEGRFEQEKVDFFKRVQKGFFWYASQKQFGETVLIDASGSIDDVSAKIKDVVSKKLMVI